MAVSNIRVVGPGVSATLATGDPLVLTTAVACAAGSTVAVGIFVDSSNTVSSVVDSAGNTYTLEAPSLDGTARTQWAWATLTNALPSGGTITVDFSTANGRKMVHAFTADGIDASSPLAAVGTATTATSASPSVSLGPFAQADNAIFAVLYLASPLSYPTEDADYEWLSDTDVDGRLWHAAGRVLASTAAETYNPTLPASKLWRANIIAFKGGDAPPSYIDDDLLLLGVG